MCIRKLLTGIFCLIGSAVFSADNANAIVINVSGTTGWTNTGIAINAGDLLQITASGSIRFESAGRQADPDGQPDGDLILSSGNVVPSVVNHTLVSDWFVGLSRGPIRISRGIQFLSDCDQ